MILMLVEASFFVKGKIQDIEKKRRKTPLYCGMAEDKLLIRCGWSLVNPEIKKFCLYPVPLNNRIRDLFRIMDPPFGRQ
jgi:hypothetical protein